MKKLVVLFSVISLILAYVLVDFFFISIESTTSIINRFPIIVMPAPYTFIFRYIVFLLLLVWVWDIFQRNIQLTERQTMLFLFSALSNIVYLYSWHTEQYTVAVILSAATFLFIGALYRTIKKDPVTRLTTCPISTYVAWTFLMFLFNLKYFLMFEGWVSIGLSDSLWAILLLTFATAIALYLMYRYEDIAIAVVFAWTYVGILVKNGLNEPFVSISTAFLIFILTMSAVLVVQRRHNN